MDYLKKLKWQGILGTVLLVVFLAGMAAVGFAGSNLFAEPPEAEELWDVPRDKLEGSYVTVEVEYIYGCYAYTEVTRDGRPTGEITEREYLIDANEQDYMALVLSGDQMEQAEKLLEESDQYYYGEIDEITETFRVTGYVRELPSDSIRLLHEAVDYYRLSPAEQDIYLPLALHSEEFELEVVPLIFGIVFAIAALVFAGLKLSGQYQKHLRRKLEQMFGGNRERSNDFMKFMLESVPKIHGLRIARGYLLARVGGYDMLYDVNDLVWAYQQTTRHRLYGIIPMGKSYSLMLCTADGKRQSITMSDKATKEILTQLRGSFPNTVIGYSKELENLYNTNRTAMAGVAASQRAHNL